MAGTWFVWGEQNKNPYVQFSVFSNDWLSLVDPHLDQLFNELLKWGK